MDVFLLLISRVCSSPKNPFITSRLKGKSLFQLMAERLKRLAHIATASRCDNDESRGRTILFLFYEEEHNEQ